MKNGDAEPELEVVLDADEDVVLNESWSESRPVIALTPPPELKPTPALPFDEGDEGMLPPYPPLLTPTCFLPIVWPLLALL